MGYIILAFNFIVKSVKLIIKAIAKIIILLNLHYVLLYLTTCLIVDLSTDFWISQNENITNYFWAGLVLVVIFSAFMSVRRVIFKKNKTDTKDKDNEKEQKMKKKKQDTEQLLQENLMLRQQILQLQNMQMQMQQNVIYSQNTNQVADDDTAFAPVANAIPNLAEQTPANTQKVAKPKKEKPKIYRSATDSDYYIYEYSTYVEIYFAKHGKLHFVTKEPK